MSDMNEKAKDETGVGDEVTAPDVHAVPAETVSAETVNLDEPSPAIDRPSINAEGSAINAGGQPEPVTAAVKLEPLLAPPVKIPQTAEIGTGEAAELEMRRMSRRSFLWTGVVLATGYAGWLALDHSRDIDGVKAPLRRALEFDERVGRSLFSPARLAPTFDRRLAQVPKPNGFYGLGTDLVPAEWSLFVEGLYARTESLELKIEDIRALPRVEMVTEHKCIEGWSTVVHWAGARFVDFATKYFPATIDGSGPDIQGSPEKLMPYVSLTTPDEEYYVGLDMASALHPQTLLCYEMDGKPLTPEHGAPLRLVIPVKYGIKAIKRIGKIAYTKDRPEDFWAKQGYDWYAGH